MVMMLSLIRDGSDNDGDDDGDIDDDEDGDNGGDHDDGNDGDGDDPNPDMMVLLCSEPPTPYF